jgi:sterol desaturase/sphingolipid hydroxylase (fatty acid hydroxylase superfamily)
MIVTPRFHTAHHTVSKRTGNANFSTIFIFWDKLFATYNEPDSEEMKFLGLEKGRETYLSFGSTLAAPFTPAY